SEKGRGGEKGKVAGGAGQLKKKITNADPVRRTNGAGGLGRLTSKVRRPSAGTSTRRQHVVRLQAIVGRSLVRPQRRSQRVGTRRIWLSLAAPVVCAQLVRVHAPDGDVARRAGRTGERGADRRLVRASALGTFAAGEFFFFSSRRRHTRLVSDWSSDVCSSD